MEYIIKLFCSGTIHIRRPVGIFTINSIGSVTVWQKRSIKKIYRFIFLDVI